MEDRDISDRYLTAQAVPSISFAPVEAVDDRPPGGQDEFTSQDDSGI
jgi:hypothetical protein